MEIDSNSEENVSGKQKISVRMVSDFLLVFFFCGIMLLFFGFNIKTLNQSFSDQMEKEGSTQQKLMSVESDFQKKVYKRTELINLYGLTLNAINWKMVGDFDFVKDSHGIIQRFEAKIDTSKFLGSMTELKVAADYDQTPLVYVSLPDKAKYLELAQGNQFCFDGQQSNQIGKQLEGTIDCLNIDSLMAIDMDAPTFDELHFKTDVHYSTYGEFWIAKILANHLQEKYKINFPNAQQVFDLNQYNIASYEFVGNTARSVGEYFVGKDNFEIYRPKFETSMQLINPSAGEKREGNFEKVMLNGYENNPTINQYTYWVTNYGRFTSPYYQYINEKAAANLPNLLIISDSVFMRGTTYLALACGKLTVLDPRYFDGTEYVAQMLAMEHYDAIIVVATSSTYYNSSFSSKMRLPDLPEESAQTADYWIGQNGICLDTYNGINIGNADSFSIQGDAMQVELIGWAADFKTRQPLSALYLQVGDQVIQCNYGIERTSVSDHYQDDNLKNTGFSVTFPELYLCGGEVDQLVFIQVGADGAYRYEPVSYQLLY